MSGTFRHRKAKQVLRQLAVELCGGILFLGSRPYEIEETVTVVIAPHQDDETLACGGVIARKRNEGLPVHVVFITDGSASHPKHPRFDSRAISEMRKGEAMKALSYLGVERGAVHFLDEPDGTLHLLTIERRADLVHRLTDLFTKIAPNEIFLPCSPDGSSEHDATFGFVREAIYRSKIVSTVWQYPVWSWWNPSLLFRSWLGTRDCRRLPVEDYQLAKQHAIKCYRSQVEPLAPEKKAALPPELVEIFNSNTEFFFRLHNPESPTPKPKK
ncbi:PIG-L deacetylase family protein [Oleiharenicola lentus]|uniref:PIG-L deacetylase family protein n=1 Tax=Oleiharenicola lentus TaxID=2508720 RepID=UPI003F66EFF4